MTEQLPVLSTFHNVSTTEKKSASLIGRGLIAIQHKETGIAQTELDARYLLARDSYNQITAFGYKTRDCWTNEEQGKLSVSFDTFQGLAAMGYGRAYFPLSQFYRGGQSIRENKELAERYAHFAFTWCFNNQSQNDLGIWNDLAFLYRFGIGIEANDSLAIYWYKKAAEQGDAPAQFRLGLIYVGRRNAEEASFWYRESAEQGYAPAQEVLGKMHANGSLGTKQDDEKAVFWFLKAIEQDYSPAIFNVGSILYGCGRHGKKQDDEKVAACYRRLAEQGDVQAQINLGWMYEIGIGVDQNDELAVFWCLKAAQCGHGRVQEILTKRRINWKNA